MKFRILILATLVASVASAQPAKTTSDYDRAAAMLSFNANKLVDKSIQPEWLPDNRIWYRSLTENASEFILFNPDTKQKLSAVSKNELFKKAGITPDETRRERNEVRSPDGKYAAFIRDWNLWIREISSGTEKALTTDGIRDFGYATDNAGWRHSDAPVLSWSPDSKKIATYQQDQRHVRDMYLVKTKVGAPELEQWKYPLPGDSAVIMIHRVIINIEGTPKIIRLKIAPDSRRGTLLDDIAWRGGLIDVAWSEDSEQLAFVSTSRDHREEKIRLANSRTGDVKELFSETVTTQYESGHDDVNWRYLSGSNEIIWYSEKTDWGHLYLYDANKGTLKNAITSGEFVVRSIAYIDEKARQIYFIGSGREKTNPYYGYLYRVDLNGKNLTLLTPNEGDHAIRLSPNRKYFIDSYSQPNVPQVHEVRTIKGQLVSLLEKTEITRLTATGWKAPTPFTVKSADGAWDLYGLMFTPSQLDETKKYPVVVNIYPGPQGGSIGWWGFTPARGDCQALAELGFVVVQLEGSCNPGRSKSFHDACYGNMGENTLPDQIAGLKQLNSKFKFLDLDKVGIWGHSGGGFATCAALLKYPEFFKVGVSQSGNHDNRNYEDEWGERYIGLLDEGEGASNYESQANQTFAKNLKGKLMLVHGGMDDNVPPYNSYLVADALIKANKDFDFILLPNARHGYGRDNFYIMRRRWDYFVQHLLQSTPPDEYQIVIKPDPRLMEAQGGN